MAFEVQRRRDTILHHCRDPGSRQAFVVGFGRSGYLRLHHCG
jgi:D-arabinose 5-phosphate isomerase GutQ